jgi:hypothetical protein
MGAHPWSRTPNAVHPASASSSGLPNTYQAPVGQVRTRRLSVPAWDAHHMAAGVGADPPFSGFVSVSQVRGVLCTKHL